MSKEKKDLHRSVIVGMIKERGKTISDLSRDNGLHPLTLSNALVRPYPKAEKIIADFLDLSPSEIWPSRY